MIGAPPIELQNAQRRRSIFVVALLGALAGLASCTSSGTKSPPPGGSGGSGGSVASTGGSTGSSTGGSTGSSAGGSTGSSAGGSNQPDAAAPDLAPPRDANVPADAVIVTDASTTATRSDLSFDTDWRFNLGDVTGADAKAFADTAWGFVDLPHSPRFNTPDSPAAYAGIM